MNGKREVKVLGISAIIWGIISFLSFFLLLWIALWFAGNLFGASATLQDSFKELVKSLPMLFPLLIILFIFCLLYIIGGIGLLYNKKWGRIFLIIASIVGLFSFPIGTVVGIIFLIFLFKKDVVKVLK